MVRSNWRKALLVLLASTGLAWGQQTAPLPAKHLTVREKDQSPLKCEILKAWTTSDGAKAFQVQSVETGEILTVVESSPPGPDRSAATRIYHWGKSKTPPPGTPMPPAAATVQAPPPAAPVRQASAVTPAAPPPTLPPPTPVSAPAVPLSALPQAPCPCENPAPTPCPCTSGPARTIWNPFGSRTSSCTECKPCNDCKPCTDCKTICTECTPGCTDCGKTDAAGRLTAKPATNAAPGEPAKANDWRQSWGKLDTTPPPNPPRAVAQTDPPKPIPPLPPPPPLPARTLPAADAKRPDPLLAPETFVPKPPEEKAPPTRILPDFKPLFGSPRPADRPLPPTVAPPAPLAPPAAPPAAPAGAPQSSGTPMPPILVPGPTTMKTVPGEVMEPQVPLGSGSVLAAGDVHYVPVPIVTLPRAQPARPAEAAKPEPQADPEHFVNAFTTPPPPSQPAPTSGMVVNAFTTGTPPVTTGPDANSFGGMPAAYGPNAQAMAAYRPAPTGVGGMPPGYLPPAAAGHMTGGMIAAGPVPPGYAAQAFQQAAYSGRPGEGVQAAGGRQPQPEWPTSSDPAVQQSLAQLKVSMMPSEREYAVMQLGELNPKKSPEAVQALLTAARTDAAGSVRAACVTALAKMKANTVPVVLAVQAMRSDSDLRVRQAAEEALAVLMPQNLPSK
jgi:hypothetical protein